MAEKCNKPGGSDTAQAPEDVIETRTQLTSDDLMGKDKPHSYPENKLTEVEIVEDVLIVNPDINTLDRG